jgi:3-mercaptopyruvate sulfurtransferase SseA
MSDRVPRGLPTITAAILFVLAGCETSITDADIRVVKITEVRDLSERQARDPGARILALIDPRSSKQFDVARIPGARNMKLPQVPERSAPDPSLAAYGHIIVYGDNPASASARAMTKRMMAVGYKGVRLFAGGLDEWLVAGYPIEPEDPPVEAEPPAPEPEAAAPPP